jgi:hypothetical protein
MFNEIYNARLCVVRSAPATYAAGAHNVLVITGGPVWIQFVVEQNVTAMAGATTTTIAVSGVGIDAGAVAIGAAAINTMVVSPLDVAVAKIAPALGVQMPSLLGFATNVGFVAGVGNIAVTFAGVAMGAAERYSLIVGYYKLLPQSLIM